MAVQPTLVAKGSPAEHTHTYIKEQDEARESIEDAPDRKRKKSRNIYIYIFIQRERADKGERDFRSERKSCIGLYSRE